MLSQAFSAFLVHSALLSSWLCSYASGRVVNVQDLLTDQVPSEDPIPKVAHFIWACVGRPLDWLEYAAIKASIVTVGVETVNLWVPPGAVLDGPVWELVLEFPQSVLREVEMPTEIYGNKIENIAHQADVLRLEVLYQEGGIGQLE